MKLRTSWCAALAVCLALLAFTPASAANNRASAANNRASAANNRASAANNRNYQMAGQAAQAADAVYTQDGNFQQASYGPSYSPRGTNGFGIAAPLADRQYQFFAYGEYLYARASFSEALAYIVTDPNNPAGGSEIVEYDFDYKSSYRFGGGIDFCDCGGAIVFDYTRLSSSADYDVLNTSSTATLHGPYEVDANPGQTLRGDADVDIKSYDIGWAKTFPLCSPMGCSGSCDPCCGDVCCDPCCGSGGLGGCGNGGCCPAWDVTWTAGVRFADADWSRRTLAIDSQSVPIDREDTSLSFSGAGLRTGLMGRRYVGRNGWFSLYARGDVSLLVGDMDIQTATTDNLGGSVPQTAISHRNSGRRVIPVTEIEAGGSLDLTSNVRMTAGYFISAWHDLGMRDEYNFVNIPQLQLSHYDDANILGFDGFFARVDVAF